MKRAADAEPAQQGGAKKAAAGVPRVKDALGYLEKVKNKFLSKPHVYNQFLDIMKDFKSQTIDTEGVIHRVKTLFKGHRNLILGFNQFLPPGFKVDMPPEKPKPAKPTSEFKHAVEYVAKIKNRFKDQPSIYGEFLDILHDYQAKRTIDEVYARVQKLFGGQPDLLNEFKYFLPDNSGNAPPPLPPARKRKSRKKERSRDRRRSRKEKQADAYGVSPSSRAGGRAKQVVFPPGTERELALFEKIKTNVHKSIWSQFLKVLNLFSLNIITRQEMMRLVEDVFGTKYSDYAERFKNAIEYDEWEENQFVMKKRTDYYAYVQSTEFKNRPRPTPSYRELPDDIPQPICTNRTALCREVLNDRAISIPWGSEDFSFKSSRKNVYEENLAKVEDERYELDMVIDTNKAAIRVLEPLLKEISEMSTFEGKKMRIPESVDVITIRAIARIYGDQGYEIVDLLRQSPATVIPLVLRRLRQKDQEWRKLRLEMKNQWRRVFEQNFYKSLDHRSFYFKQEDKKRLTGRSLLNELRTRHSKVFGTEVGSRDASLQTRTSSRIKEKDHAEEQRKAEEARREQEKAAHWFYAGSDDDIPDPLFCHCMKFEMGDAQVHEDVYALVSHVAASSLTVEKQVKFFEFWHEFFHSFLDFKPKSLSPEATEAAEASEEKMLVKQDQENAVAAEAGAGAAEEEEDADMKEASSKSKKDVKPVRLMLETWELEEKLSPVPRHTRPSRLMIANDSFYVAFRYYQFLYSRMSQARRLAAAWKKPGEKKKSRRRKKRKEPQTPEEAYTEFRTLLYELVDGNLENSKFEDDCRTLLGAKSYVLFTLDRLVMQTVKLVNNLTSNATAKNLRDVYEFEQGQLDRLSDADRTLERVTQLYRGYHTSCVTLLGDTTCCLIEYFKDTNELALGLAESLIPPVPRDVNDEVLEYVDSYMKGAADPPVFTENMNRPFRMRNLRSFKKNPLRGLELINDLKARLHAKSYKLTFVEDTGDFLFRHGRKDEAKAAKLLAMYRARAELAHGVVKERFLNLPALEPGDPRFNSHDDEEKQKADLDAAAGELMAMDAERSEAVEEPAEPQAAAAADVETSAMDVEVADDADDDDDMPEDASGVQGAGAPNGDDAGL